MISDGRNTFLIDGNNADIVNSWRKWYETFKDQPIKIVSELRNASVQEACEAIFSYMVKNTYYKLDGENVQYIKSPARFLADRCGDCKSYTMFICCCLHCLGIPHIARFVNFNGGSQYTHVYPVAIDETGREIIMDACELNDDGIPYIDYARPYKKKKDLYYSK